MLIALTLAAALTGQVTPPAPEGRPEIIRDVRVFTRGGPDGPDMDKNGDGFITREEFTAPRTAAFDMLDANKDGRVSTEEFTSGRAAAHVILGEPGGHGGPGGVRVHLGGPDGPGPMGDGNVTMFRHGGPDGRDGPGDLDKDGDGKVSEAEFLAPLREAFQRMDTDHSGSLDAGENGPGRGVFIMRHAGPDGGPAERPAH